MEPEVTTLLFQYSGQTFRGSGIWDRGESGLHAPCDKAIPIDDSTMSTLLFLVKLFMRDCKQVVIGMVFNGEGFPRAHEIFPGNRRDSTTVDEMLKLGSPQVRHPVK